MPASWSQGQDFGVDMIEDLSDTGLFLLTSATLRVGGGVELELDTPDGHLELSARVVRPESRRGQVVGYGLRFQGLDDHDRRALARVIRTHRYRFSVPEQGHVAEPVELEPPQDVVRSSRGLVVAASVILFASVALIGAAALLLS
jgi:hypothetical protein